ncbi:uncharacterized protein [Physcomitrium patens]|uniref:WRKY domain-containing protein n=1 Tax=Physcomitrium patens TaxID=3218 RepID=A0A7I4E2B0_PHYPA|nr:probable WRKY transcription factor 65 isoform X2 [Physcomitrium patens]|eukprot:XP_024377829.1 probable WRKY transcription factor 65 isoform X2 [Physcomitrella patens]
MEQDQLCWYDAGEDSSSQQRQKPQQGQKFSRLPVSMQVDHSEWPMLAETGWAMDSTSLPPPLPSDPRQCSSSFQISNGGMSSTFSGDKNQSVPEEQSYINKAPLRANRARNNGGKSDVRKLSGNETKVEVVLQKLNDAKKGIPDDGHRGWKKYGNKSIQNSNHCRGYYKCSVKECRAKKMVQPTDTDPTVFEVTYVEKHTCSSTAQRRNRSTRVPAGSAAHAGPSQGKDKSAEANDDEQATFQGAIQGAASCKRGRENESDNHSYLNNMDTSTTTTASEEEREQVMGDGDAPMETYLHQSTRHHQSAYGLDPLIWPFEMEASLSSGHKSVSMDSDSP